MPPAPTAGAGGLQEAHRPANRKSRTRKTPSRRPDRCTAGRGRGSTKPDTRCRCRTALGSPHRYIPAHRTSFSLHILSAGKLVNAPDACKLDQRHLRLLRGRAVAAPCLAPRKAVIKALRFKVAGSGFPVCIRADAERNAEGEQVARACSTNRWGPSRPASGCAPVQIRQTSRPAPG